MSVLVSVGLGANSFLSIADADNLFADIYGADAWTTFTSEQKRQLLIDATTRINTFNFAGLRTNRAQNLVWPRTGIFSFEGTYLSSEHVPIQVMQATCELAKWIWTESERNMSDDELQQYKSVAIGPINVTPKGSPMLVPQKVLQLLGSIGPGVLINVKAFTGSQIGFAR